MWSSYSEFNAHKSRSNSSSNNSNSGNDSLNLSSSFYDGLLGSIDTPDNTNSDCSSVKSEMETDEDEITSEKKNIHTSEEMKPTMSTAHLITSLDHCYNISSTHLDNERFLGKSEPLTPPVSSDDEDSNQNPFSFPTTTCSSHNRNQNTLTKP